MGGAVPICVFVPGEGVFLMRNPRGKSLNTYGNYLPQERQTEAPPFPQKCEVGTGTGTDGAKEVNEHDELACKVEVGGDQLLENNTEADNGGSRRRDSVLHVASDRESDPKSQPPPPSPQQQAPLYLLIEEVLFLHERGLVEVYDEDEKQRLDSKDLFAMLPKLGVAFPVYLTYAHLRAQTYIVMRHAPRRLDIVDALAEKSVRKRKRDEKEEEKSGDVNIAAASMAASTTSEKEQIIEKKGCLDKTGSAEVTKPRETRGANLKRRLRAVEFNAPAPILMRSTDAVEKWSQHLSSARSGDNGHQEPVAAEEQHAVPGACSLPSTCPIAFHVYGPNSAFKRTDPGRPDFCVAIASYAEASPCFGSINALVSIARGVPVRISTVADGGTVVMFSLTDYGVPPIAEIKAASAGTGGGTW